MRIPKVEELMTPAARTIGEDISVSIAKQHMRALYCRHLPVLKNGQLVGIISDRDIKVAESFTGKGELTVGEVMTPEPYVVSPKERIDRVMENMAERKYGCALVQDPDSNSVIGIFTDTDALRFSANLLKQEFSIRSRSQRQFLRQGVKLLVAHRRLFENDESRFFVGEVGACDWNLTIITGYSWFYSALTGTPIRKEGVRTKIISLTSGALISYLLPTEIDLSTVQFELKDARLWLKASPNFELDLSESYFHRSEQKVA